MTDRLIELLRDEAGSLDVPPPPARDVLARGRARRRRRAAGASLAGIAAAAVLVGAVLVLPDGGDTPPGRAIDPASAAYAAEGAFAVDRTIYFGAGTDHAVTVDADVKGLYYTSAGVVVRSGRTPFTDDAGPSRYGIVEPGGDVRSLGVRLGDVAPSTDAAQPYLAWASRADTGDDAWLVHVLDVRTGEDTTAAVTGAFTWGGWEAPPVSLDGDTVYVGLDAATVAVDWRQGTAEVADAMRASFYPEVRGGHTAVEPAFTIREDPDAVTEVLDAASGRVLMSEATGSNVFVALSPDGRYLKVAHEAINAGDSFEVYEVASGTGLTVDGAASEWGWTPDGGLLRVEPGGVTACAPGTLECRTTPVELGRGTLRIGGNSYES